MIIVEVGIGLVALAALALHFRKPRVHVIEVAIPPTQQVAQIKAVVPATVQSIEVKVPTTLPPAVCYNCKKMVSQYEKRTQGAICPSCGVKNAN